MVMPIARTMVLLALVTAACPCNAIERAAQKGPDEWQAMARADLDAAHAIIVSSHPGVIDSENPGFNKWVEEGYQEAKAYIPNVVSYDTAMAAVRHYTTGFGDGHLTYSDDIRGDDPILLDGWLLGQEHGQYRVVATIKNWPVRLPPVGAELVDCDGRTPETILREDVAPFVGHRDAAETRKQRIGDFWALHPTGTRLHRCSFRTEDGGKLDLPIEYAPVTWEQYFAALPDTHDGSNRSPNAYDLRDGVLWIRAGNFMLRASADDSRVLEKMLTELPRLNGVKQIVFDARGNGGGESSVGDRIFEAATGGLVYDTSDLDHLPRLYAQWRVSDLLVATVTEQIARLTKLYGPRSERVTDAKAFLDSILAAKSAGRTWVDQDAGHRITRAGVVARHGHLRRFDGKVVLITDDHCVSACLDFADEVLQVPGSIHIGQTTGADTVYIDVGDAKLPSGNHLEVPLKVWRNRVRGNNEPLVPDVRLDVDMADDAAVRRAVLAVLIAH